MMSEKKHIREKLIAIALVAVASGLLLFGMSSHQHHEKVTPLAVTYEKLYWDGNSDRLYVITNATGSTRSRVWFRIPNDFQKPLAGNTLTPGGWLIPPPRPLMVLAPAPTGLMIAVDSDGVPDDAIKVVK